MAPPHHRSSPITHHLYSHLASISSCLPLAFSMAFSLGVSVSVFGVSLAHFGVFSFQFSRVYLCSLLLAGCLFPPCLLSAFFELWASPDLGSRRGLPPDFIFCMGAFAPLALEFNVHVSGAATFFARICCCTTAERWVATSYHRRRRCRSSNSPA